MMGEVTLLRVKVCVCVCGGERGSRGRVRIERRGRATAPLGPTGLARHGAGARCAPEKAAAGSAPAISQRWPRWCADPGAPHRHGAWGIGHGAWHMGHVKHGAWGMGHEA